MHGSVNCVVDSVGAEDIDNACDERRKEVRNVKGYFAWSPVAGLHAWWLHAAGSQVAKIHARWFHAAGLLAAGLLAVGVLTSCASGDGARPADTAQTSIGSDQSAPDQPATDLADTDGEGVRDGEGGRVGDDERGGDIPRNGEGECVGDGDREGDGKATFDAPVEISLWTYPVGNWGNQSTVSSLLGGFHRMYPQYHVTVKFLNYTTGDDEIEEALAAGGGPDLVLEGPERLVANWGSRGLMVDLSDLWETEKAGQIYEEVREACHDEEGRFYEYPICMTTHCMAINYDMFQEAGALRYIDEKNHTWSTEDFVNAIAALKDAGHERVGVVFCGGQGGDQGTRALVNNLYGGTFTNEDHTSYTVNSEANAKALELLAGLDGIEFDPTIVGGDEVELFGKGQLAMAFCWNVSMEVTLIVNNPNLEFDVFPMAFPTQGDPPRLQGGIWGFGIFDHGDAAKVEAAKALIRYMTEDDSRYKRAVQTSSYWPVRTVEDVYANDELMTEYGTFMQYMGNYYQVTPGWADVRTAWWKMLQDVGKGMEVNVALEKFDKAAKAAAESAQKFSE